MSKILANAVLPFALFSSGILLMGCEQAVEAPAEQADTTTSDLELLNGQVDFSQVNLKKIESQMVNVQSEMVKLAGLLIQNPDQESESNTNQDNT